MLLAGCASLPPPPMPARDALRDFALDGRFALRVSRPDQPAQSSAGRLSWIHQQDSDRIQLANPLGYAVAEIETSPGRSRLRTANGQIHEASDPETLLESVTGQRLPLSRLPGWLLGRGEQINRDTQGRPAQLREAGWQVDYSYDSDAPDALPSRLNIRYPEEIELKLRIETWKEAP